MLVLGLTGGIAAGKTTAGDYLAAQGVTIIDTDIIARKLLTEPSVQDTIINTFDAQVTTNEGKLDRERLRALVFSHVPHLRHLEAILHPLIEQAMASAIQRVKPNTPYVAVVVPLLFEMGWNHMVDTTLAITCNQTTRWLRLQAKGMSSKMADTIISWQISAVMQAQCADYVLTNNGTQAEFLTALSLFHKRFMIQCATLC